MNICIICNEYPEGPHGGIGAMNQLLARELVKLNNNVKVIGLYDNSYQSPEFEVDNGVEVYRVKAKLHNKLYTILGWLKLHFIIKKWIKKGTVEIVEIPDSYGWFSAFGKLNVPLIVRAHGASRYFSYILKEPIKFSTNYLEGRLLKQSDAICCVSIFTKSIIDKVFTFKHASTVIYNGIDVLSASNYNTTLPPLDKVYFNIIFSGTLIEKKGVFPLTKAIVELLTKGYKIKLIYNGKDSINPKTNKSVKEELLNLIPEEYHSSFLFNGHISKFDLYYYYYNGDLAIFPSFAEAFAMAPLEAMSTGIPTIYTCLGSGNELINNWTNGILINPHDVDDIKNNIIRAMSDPENLRSIGTNGKMHVLENFNQQKMALESINLYNKLKKNETK